MARGVTVRGFQRNNNIADNWYRAIPNQIPQRVKQRYTRQIARLTAQSVLWGKIGALYWFGTPTGTSALFDVKNPTGTAPTAVNTPGFTRMKGFTGNGVNGYIDFNRAWSAMPSYGQNDAHIVSAAIINGNTTVLGTNTTGYTNIGRTGGNISLRMNGSATTQGSALANTTFNILGGVRNNAANYDRYLNGVLDGNVVEASVALSGNNALSLSNTGSFAGTSTRVSGHSFGAALTADEMAALTTFFRNMAYICGATV